MSKLILLSCTSYSLFFSSSCTTLDCCTRVQEGKKKEERGEVRTRDRKTMEGRGRLNRKKWEVTGRLSKEWERMRLEGVEMD